MKGGDLYWCTAKLFSAAKYAIVDIISQKLDLKQMGLLLQVFVEFYVNSSSQRKNTEKASSLMTLAMNGIFNRRGFHHLVIGESICRIKHLALFLID